MREYTHAPSCGYYGCLLPIVHERVARASHWLRDENMTDRNFRAAGGPADGRVRSDDPPGDAVSRSCIATTTFPYQTRQRPRCFCRARRRAGIRPRDRRSLAREQLVRRRGGAYVAQLSIFTGHSSSRGAIGLPDDKRSMAWPNSGASGVRENTYTGPDCADVASPEDVGCCLPIRTTAAVA